MRFQVLLPVYNSSKWFEAALASVVGHPDGEVLVIDDGSRDDERRKIIDICARYKGVQLFLEPHRGISGTLNFGLSVATAPYIARMDADDISLPHRFDAQLKALDQDPTLALVGGQYSYIDEQTQRYERKEKYPLSHDDILSLMRSGRSCIQHPTIMMRRDPVLALGGYRAITDYAEDYDLFLRLSRKYKLINLDDILILYRFHQNQITTKRKLESALVRSLSCTADIAFRSTGQDPHSNVTDCNIFEQKLEHQDSQINAFLKLAQMIKNPEEAIYNSEVQLKDISTYLANGFEGLDVKSRARALALIANIAIRKKNFPLAASASLMAYKKKPSAFYKYLIQLRKNSTSLASPTPAFAGE